MEFGDPEEVSREVLDFTFFVVFGQFLFVVIEAGGETAFGVFVHFFRTNLELDDFFVFSDDGRMKGLITVLFRDGDVIFYAAIHRRIKRVEKTHSEIATRNVGDNNAECG